MIAPGQWFASTNVKATPSICVCQQQGQVEDGANEQETEVAGGYDSAIIEFTHEVLCPGWCFDVLACSE
jgi:hypothetical protein